jgi:HK97 family phage major capsid protein
MSEVKDATATEVVEQDIVLEKAELDQIADTVGKSMQPTIDEAVAKAAEAAAKSAVDGYIAKTEEVETKKGLKQAAVQEKELDAVAKGLKDGSIDERVAKMTPAMRFLQGMKALVNEDRATLGMINSYTIASQKAARDELMKSGDQEAIAKAGYANEAVAADGSVLIPDAEFVTTVFDNLPKYGVAFSYADVRQTDRTSVRVISLDSGLTFYATAEAGVKTSAKLAFSKNEVSLQKYAVIVPATDELTDDAAIDYWNVVTRELTRAYAKVADEITFTDTTYGITNLSGVLTENVSGAGTTLKWDDLLDAQAKTEDGLDESNHKWFMRKESWYRLVQTKGTTNDAYIAGSLNTATGWVANPNQPTTPWGTPVVFTRVLPSTNSVQTNDAFAVYGDLSNYILYNKRGMALKMLSEATILDQAGASFNLATQDAQAMRAVVRLLGICPKGNRSKFVVLGTGTVS